MSDDNNDDDRVTAAYDNNGDLVRLFNVGVTIRDGDDELFYNDGKIPIDQL